MSDILISNNNLIYSELQEDEVSLNCTFIICDFGINGNNVMLNRKTIDSWIETLISQPVVASITINDDGNCDFSGHNVIPVNRVDENGKVYQDNKFDTSAIGTFNSVSIEKINGKEYIVATAKIWKRFNEFCSLIKKRMSDGSIGTSWEIAVDSSHYEIIGGQKIKVIDKGNFMGHALLNKSFPPAYKDSKMLEVASNQNDDDLIEAIKQDIAISNVLNINNNQEEDKNLEENIKDENITETTVIAEPVKTENPETAMLTEFDLKQSLRQAVAEKLNIDRWEFCLIYHFPADGIVWIQKWDAESELDIIQFTYTVENDIVTVSEPVEAKLTVSVAQINTTVSELNSKIDTLNNSLVEASGKIQNLTKEVSELTPYKLSAEKAEQERIELETSEKRESMKKFAIDSKFITEQELSSVEDIKNCIENIDEKGLKAIIAERFMKTLEPTNSKTIEISTIKEEKEETPKLNIIDNIDIEVSSKSIMKKFLSK